METICRYRQIGLSLRAIQRILNASDTGPRNALEQRLQAIDRQMAVLRDQQRVIRTLLGDTRLNSTEGLTRDKWTTLLRASGLSNADMVRWHMEFERLFPLDHQAFLESLGIPEQDIKAVRAMSCQGGD